MVFNDDGNLRGLTCSGFVDQVRGVQMQGVCGVVEKTDDAERMQCLGRNNGGYVLILIVFTG